MRIDALNLRILALLQKDARTTVMEIARTVGRAESTIRERVASLERDGVILGYRAELDQGALGNHVRVLLRAECPAGRRKEFAERLAALPYVVAAHVTTSPRSLFVEFLLPGLDEFFRLVEERLEPMGLRSHEADVVVHTLVASRAMPASAAQPQEGREAGDGSRISAGGGSNGSGGIRVRYGSP